MHVDLASKRVSEDEVTFPGVIATLFTIAASRQKFAQRRHILVRHGDVEVAMRPALFAQQGVHSPPTIDVDFQAVLLQKLNEPGGIAGIHEPSLRRSRFRRLRQLRIRRPRIWPA